MPLRVREENIFSKEIMLGKRGVVVILYLKLEQMRGFLPFMCTFFKWHQTMQPWMQALHFSPSTSSTPGCFCGYSSRDFGFFNKEAQVQECVAFICTLMKTDWNNGGIFCACWFNNVTLSRKVLYSTQPIFSSPNARVHTCLSRFWRKKIV